MRFHGPCGRNGAALLTPPGGILLIASNFPPVRGGSAVVYDNLARNADGRIIVMAPKINYRDGLPIIGWREHDRHAPYRIIRLPLLRTKLRDGRHGGIWKLSLVVNDIWIRLRLIAAVLLVIRHERISAVCIGELLASGWMLGILRWLTKVRLLVYVHGEEITTEDGYDKGARRRRQALLADRIIVVSRFTQAAIRSLLGPSAEAKLSLIGNGVDTRRFRCGKRQPELIDQYSLRGRFVFISVCRLLEKKGIDNAIHAFAELDAVDQSCSYLIVGMGPFQQELREIAAATSAKDRIVFTGEVTDDDLADHYRLGDVFIMPNRELANGDTEGFGLVFLEANSCGLPVIAGRDGGSTDAVCHGRNGLIVNGKSVAEIASAMATLRSDTLLRAKLRKGGRATAAAAGWQEKAAMFVRLCAGETGNLARVSCREI